MVLAEECFGCGVCEAVCPLGAITQASGFPVVYSVDPLACNDCNECHPLCPVSALVPDPAFATCHGRGCPLSAARYEGWDCSEGQARCEHCGGMLWRAPDSQRWACRTCDGAGKATCPKVRQRSRLLASSSA